ncbi:hypothetical protein GOP47_0005234 [Adiantum capillus-veneris]|uniref:Uncharacterized protein n=1 Tax=Adiantum capillus-veneris TaxID=13818 RepID=A0A9D4V4Q8_ADICA|nr:hypothetical protein GOP47_0005234 [Adiantum capillus-veneris]
MESVSIIDNFPPNVRLIIAQKLQETWAVELKLQEIANQGSQLRQVLHVDAFTQSTWDVKFTNNLLYIQLMTHWDFVDEVVFTTVAMTSFSFYGGVATLDVWWLSSSSRSFFAPT